MFLLLLESIVIRVSVEASSLLVYGFSVRLYDIDFLIYAVFVFSDKDDKSFVHNLDHPSGELKYPTREKGRCCGLCASSRAQCWGLSKTLKMLTQYLHVKWQWKAPFWNRELSLRFVFNCICLSMLFSFLVLYFKVSFLCLQCNSPKSTAQFFQKTRQQHIRLKVKWILYSESLRAINLIVLVWLN